MKNFILTIFTENKVGMLNRVTIIFTRRRLNIDSITVSESEIKGVYRYTILVRTTEDQIHKVKGQIEKLIDVVKVAIFEEQETVYQEIALYKLPINTIENKDLQELIISNNARILSKDSEYLVVEKTGNVQETQQFFDQLYPFKILEFVRSGGVAVAKSERQLTTQFT